MEKMRCVVLTCMLFGMNSLTHSAESTWETHGQKYSDYDGIRVKTLNNMGVEHLPLDPYSEDFLNSCQEQGDKIVVLEIGAAFGHVSLEALSRGVKNVHVNDLDQRHLDVFLEKVPSHQKNFVTLIAGDFPEQFQNLPDSSFDTVLAARVFHFFPPQKLEAAVNALYRLIKPNGKAFIVCESPYLKSNAGFIGEYEERIKNGDLYPGLIENVHERFPHLATYMPNLLHYMDPTVLMRLFIDAGFQVEKCDFMNRMDYPERLRLDGRESVGIIARKVDNGRGLI